MIDTVYMLELCLLLAGIGIIGGFLSGLLGIGGGLVFVPALYFCFAALDFESDYLMHLAVGTCFAIIVPTGLISAHSHWKRGAVDKAVLKSWGPYLMLGVLTGFFCIATVSGVALKEIFAVVTLLMAAYMVFGRERPVGKRPRLLTSRVQELSCVIIGFFSSLVGIGGAIMTVPLMTYSGLSMNKAVGTGSALTVLVAMAGLVNCFIAGLPDQQHLPPFSLGYVNVLAAALVVPTAMLMAPLGVRAAHDLPKRTLRIVFAIVLVIVSMRMMVSL